MREPCLKSVDKKRLRRLMPEMIKRQKYNCKTALEALIRVKRKFDPEDAVNTKQQNDLYPTKSSKKIFLKVYFFIFELVPILRSIIHISILKKSILILSIS